MYLTNKQKKTDAERSDRSGDSEYKMPHSHFHSSFRDYQYHQCVFYQSEARSEVSSRSY